MKILVLGGSGMLGHKIVQYFSDKFEVSATVRDKGVAYKKFGIFEKVKLIEDLDVLNNEEIEELVAKLKPDVLVNCVGIIKQIPSSKSIIKTIQINALLPHRLAEIATKNSCKLIAISTDCVFDGERGLYSEEDRPNAIDLYGKSKHLGEVVEGNHLTLRTSIIGRELSTSHSLIEWFLSNRDMKAKGFTNAIYSGFPTVIFADIIADIILKHQDLQGLYHVSSEPINKFDLLVLVNKYFDAGVEIERFDEFQIDRSLDSTKFRQATGFEPKNWEEMIRIMAHDADQYSDWR
jgi:dTDP-4-dehydrorhamnose reductase